MKWDYEVSQRASEQLKRLGPSVQARVSAWLEKRVKGTADPRLFGKPLRHGLKGLWRYRVQDVRLICRLEDHRLIVLVVEVGHRSTVYDG